MHPLLSQVCAGFHPEPRFQLVAWHGSIWLRLADPVADWREHMAFFVLMIFLLDAGSDCFKMTTIPFTRLSGLMGFQ
ncbi:MAG TPA: hypothetical protein DCR61_11545 [Verrucomicrobiales bacterium]|nr:hypothetical protein [Pedosphaera sp.]HAQ99976.1 hypothetical protein [Verrucomicrobiales bacterium]HBP57144.1 hypothetical protein [Verrucomicrobiales bacterium]HCP38499.1 hypothetical protein [Verrucomicrobiales bacterium]